MSTEAPKRKVPIPVIVLLAIAAVLSLYLAIQGFWTLAIFWGIFAPMLAAGALVLFGARRFPGGLLWLTGAGFVTIPAAYMSMASMCKRGEGDLPNLANSHKAIYALIVLAIGWAVLFLVRNHIGRLIFVGCSVFGMVWMFLRLRKGEEMIFAAIIIVILLVGAIANEVIKTMRARAIEKELQQMAAAGGTAAPG